MLNWESLRPSFSNLPGDESGSQDTQGITSRGVSGGGSDSAPTLENPRQTWEGK